MRTNSVSVLGVLPPRSAPVAVPSLLGRRQPRLHSNRGFLFPLHCTFAVRTHRILHHGQRVRRHSHLISGNRCTSAGWSASAMMAPIPPGVFRRHRLSCHLCACQDEHVPAAGLLRRSRLAQRQSLAGRCPPLCNHRGRLHRTPAAVEGSFAFCRAGWRLHGRGHYASCSRLPLRPHQRLSFSVPQPHANR